MGHHSGGGAGSGSGDGSFGDERFGHERFGDERFGDERFGDERFGSERARDGEISGEPDVNRTPSPRGAERRFDARSEDMGRTTGGFDALGAPGPLGAASISLLLNMLVERTRSQAWSVERQRAHARVLLELARDHWFSDEETAVLCAFLR
jgi:hypothetical protein